MLQQSNHYIDMMTKTGKIPCDLSN